jgi:phosphatidylglycerol:prolipoprotein diacylglycerol transferase
MRTVYIGELAGEFIVHPICITLGPLEIRWYGVCIALGLLLGHRLFQKRAPRLGLDATEASNFIILLFLSGILGARFYYVILNWQAEFSSKPFDEVFRIDKGGQVFYGGFLGALLFLFWWCRWKKRSFADLADALVPPLAMGQALGRVGCFMNGCCFGSPCDHFWAVPPPAGVVGSWVHPVQLYEVIGLLDIFVALLVIEKLKRFPGYTACSYVILYSILRFVVEFFRGDISRPLPGHLTIAQGLSIAMLICAWILTVKLARRQWAGRREAILKEIDKLK